MPGELPPPPPALRDAVTGMAREDLVWQMLNHGMSRAQRTQHSLAVLVIYAEGVGEVNRTHGEKAGDEVLATQADRLRTLLRGTDTVGRFGGTKLVVLLESIAQAADVQLVAEKIIQALAEPVPVPDGQGRLGCSVGIALYPSTATTPENLIRHATAAMDAVKDDGGNGFQFG